MHISTSSTILPPQLKNLHIQFYRICPILSCSENHNYQIFFILIPISIRLKWKCLKSFLASAIKSARKNFPTGITMWEPLTTLLGLTINSYTHIKNYNSRLARIIVCQDDGKHTVMKLFHDCRVWHCEWLINDIDILGQLPTLLIFIVKLFS